MNILEIVDVALPDEGFKRPRPRLLKLDDVVKAKVEETVGLG